jgi:hypothetical protein
VHCTQVAAVSPLVPLHSVVLPEHVPFVLPQTQTCCAVQILLLPTQSLSPRQPTVHMLEPLQYCSLGHWLSSVHATHAFVTALQTGVGSPQSACVVHSTQMPSSTGPKQIGVLSPHGVPAGLQTQVPETHALLSPLHSLVSRQPGAQELSSVQY